MSQEDDEYWSGRILDARRNQLESVRKASAAWAGIFAAVLGVFGSVTFVTGLASLSELTPGVRVTVRIFIAGATGCTLAATILSALASNSLPRVSGNLSVDHFRAEMKSRAQTALYRMRIAMALGAVAASLVVLGSLIVLFSNDPQRPSVQPIMVIIHGDVYCGVPAVGNNQYLRLGSRNLTGVTSMMAVPACPSPG